MANEEEVKVDVEEDDQETPETDLKDDTDWKAEAIKARGMFKRAQTKLIKATEKKVDVSQDNADKKSGFDYSEKAFLKASGISSDEYGLVQEAMQNTGKSLDELLDSKWFQAELKEVRSEKASKEAIPSGTKRSGSSSRDSVDYWIAKGELPPTDQRELRRQVVNARIKAEKEKSQFTDKPVG